MSDKKVIICWFRDDLRLADNPALHAAAQTKMALVPVYIINDQPANWNRGSAGSCYLARSVRELSAALKRKSSKLTIRKGSAACELEKLCKCLPVAAVYCSQRFDPVGVAEEKQVKAILAKNKVDFKCFNSNLLCDPQLLMTIKGTPYRVFGAFYKKLQTCQRRPVVEAPRKLRAPVSFPASLSLNHFHLALHPPWGDRLISYWSPGEKCARLRVHTFIRRKLNGYRQNRDYPASAGTSRLGASLTFGEISSLWLEQEVGRHRGAAKSEFLRQLAWREFSYYTLYHFPHTTNKPLDEKFKYFRWRRNQHELSCWQRGQTGYPIVDAGMNELWTTGYMHNRVRMIVASFLTKDLLQPWLEGALWFWDTLVDADLANNTMGWQWVSGCGADAAPYFRIFNPTLQSRKFDPSGAYIKKWVPQLAKLPEKWVHEPWLAPLPALAEAGVVMGKTYPRPIVDHVQAKKRALFVYARLSQKTAQV